MISVVAVGAAEVRELGFVVGGYSVVFGERMEAVRRALEGRRGSLPEISSGGSVANTADLIAHAGVSCGFIRVGGVGNDIFVTLLFPYQNLNT